MELLYIYIEDDGRNIKDCEFNFSPQYRFHYDKVSNTLTKEKMPSYIPNFWSAKNIKNITAIIGKNGAGKSNLVEFVTQALCGGLNGRSNRLLIWKRNGQLFSNKNVISEFELQTSQYLFNPLADVAGQGIRDTLLLYFSPNIDRTISTNSSTKNFSDISTAHMLRVEKKYPEIQYHFPDIEYTQIMDTFRQLLFFIEFGNTALPKGMTIPEYLTIKLYTRGDYANSHPTYVNLRNENEKTSFERELRNILLKQIFSKKVPENWDENTELDIVMQQTSYNAQSKIGINSFYKEMLQLFEDSNIKCKLSNQKARRGGGWDDFTFSIRRTAIDERVFTILIDFYRQINGFNNATFSSIESDAFVIINNQCVIKWNGLSSGELALFNLLSRIQSKLRSSQREIYSFKEHKAYVQNKSNYKNIILILDEPETSLHPEWQRQFLNIIIESLRQSFNNFNFQIITTSHSPIIVSDFPKGNIIFLERTIDGCCKVVDNANMENTFGANIHSLYKHSFFMNLPIGDFARKRIEQLFDNLRSEPELSGEELCRIKSEIQLVGEPLLRNQLMKLHLEKCNIEERISYLENELAKLKG